MLNSTINSSSSINGNGSNGSASGRLHTAAKAVPSTFLLVNGEQPTDAVCSSDAGIFRLAALLQVHMLVHVQLLSW